MIEGGGGFLGEEAAPAAPAAPAGFNWGALVDTLGKLFGKGSEAVKDRPVAEANPDVTSPWIPEVQQQLANMGFPVSEEQLMSAYDAGAWPIGAQPGMTAENFGDVGAAATGGIQAPPTLAGGGGWLNNAIDYLSNPAGLAGVAGTVLGGAGQMAGIPELAQAGQGAQIAGNLLGGNYAGAAGGALGLAGQLAGDPELADALGLYGSTIGSAAQAGATASGAAAAGSLGAAAGGATVPLAFMDLGGIINGIAGQFSDYQPSDKDLFGAGISPWVDPKTKSLTQMQYAMEGTPGLIDYTRQEALGPNYVDPNAHDYVPGDEFRQGKGSPGPYGEYTDEATAILNSKQAEWERLAQQQGGIMRNVNGNQELMPFAPIFNEMGENTGQYETPEMLWQRLTKGRAGESGTYGGDAAGDAPSGAGDAGDSGGPGAF